MNIGIAHDRGTRLKVLRLCTSFMPPAKSLKGTNGRCDPVGGMQNHTFELTKALDRLGVEQIVVTTRLPNTAARQKIGSRSQIIRLGIPINRLRQLYGVPAAGVLTTIGPVALVHAHLGEDLALLPLAVLAARVHRTPLVITIHCSLRHTLESRDLRTSLLTSLGGRLERWACEQADGIIVLTERLAELKRRDGLAPDAIHVVPPGVDVELFQGVHHDPFPDLGGPLIVFAGRLVPEKGVDTLVRAAALLKTAGASLLLVGDGPERRQLEETAARLDIGNRVRFTGFVPHDSIPSILRRADVFVLPSLSEELGSVLLEAMHSGAAIVASRTGGIPALIQHGRNGLLVSPGDASELAAAIDRLLSEPVFASRIRGMALRDAGNRDWSTVAERVRAIYVAILQQAPDFRESAVSSPGGREPGELRVG
jgi:glycogen synthase